MQSLLDFVKSTVIGGLLVVVPIVLVVAIFQETISTLEGLVAPLLELLPVEHLGGPAVAAWAAVLLVLLVCFVAGLVVQTTLGAGLLGWFERRVLQRVPGYGVMRTLSRQFAGRAEEEESTFAPAVLRVAEEILQLVYVIEDHGNGFCTIMVPSAPTGMLGAVQYVSSERLQRLDVPLGKVVACLQSFGIGSRDLFVAEHRA